MSTLEAFARRGKLTDRIMSKAVLAPIALGHQPPRALVDHLGLGHDVPRIEALMRRNAGAIGDTGGPKYLPFYRAIKERFPTFDWRVTEDQGRLQVHFDKPYINFVRPSLLTLVTCCVRDQVATVPAMKVRYPSTRGLPDALVSEFDVLLKELSFYLPSDDYIGAVSEVLLKGLAGEEITLISPVCPDYGYVRNKDRYRYTFDQLGDGIGLVAGRILATLPRLRELLTRHGIRSRVVIAAGDFEGLDEATVARVKETRFSFLEKVRRSQDKIIAALGFEAASVYIATLAGGEAAWRELTARAYRSLCGEDLDGLMPTRIDLDSILETRMQLYQAWHVGRSRAELAQVLLSQCAEYAAMGALFHRSFSNPLVIGGDHCRMMPFYWLHQPIAVLYLRRVY